MWAGHPGVNLILTRPGSCIGVVAWWFSALCGVAAASAAPSDYFAIQVIDEATGRGVPLVELTTVHGVSSWTDSGGWVAFYEPGLMDRQVYFHVRSHGYEYPKDYFNNRGVKLRPTPGGETTLKVKRLNIAERLYRITGGGIYRDTELLGRRAPTRQPLLNGLVLGQDTVIATPYDGKIFWFWGDTDRASYPLGNFGASGATSQPPGRGGLDPGVGVDLTYFTDSSGFSKPMCPDAEFGPGLKWIEGVMTLRDERGRERLVARVAAGTGLERTRDWHLAVFNDQRQIFESIARWDIHGTHDSAHPFRARVDLNEYLYLYPNLRVRADLTSLTNLDAYEGFTCLAPGTRFEGSASKLNRAPDGSLRYEWRAGAGRLSGPQLRELTKAGLLQPGESWAQFLDVDSGRPLALDRGSVCWNDYRRRWVMIASGSAGEIWFAEADTPVGPWVYARRIVTHDQYNFYNPTQHPFFDEDGGRVIYFEGTYTASFSGAKSKTPRYDYNQIMHRLSLDDARLALPVPVYHVQSPSRPARYLLREAVGSENAWSHVTTIAFFAIPPGRAGAGFIPIFSADQGDRVAFNTRADGPQAKPLFFALPPGTNPPAGRGLNSEAASRSPAIVPLYEYRHERDGARLYATEATLANAGFSRGSEPLCRVWRNPLSLLILDANAKPASSGLTR